MFLLAVNSKEDTFAMMLMIEDAPLRGRVVKGFCHSHYPPTPTESNNLNRTPSKTTLEKCDKDAKVSSPHFLQLSLGWISRERLLLPIFVLVSFQLL